MPVTIADGFASAAEETRQGKRVNWRQALVVLEMIDIMRTHHGNIVCVRPDSNGQREDLAYKTLLLQNYAGIDPVVDEVIKQMRQILNLHNIDVLIDELLTLAEGKFDRAGLETWLDSDTFELTITPRTTLALQGRDGFEAVVKLLEREPVERPRVRLFSRRSAV